MKTLENQINYFEYQKDKDYSESQKHGIAYTPFKIIDLMVENTIRLYLENFIQSKDINLSSFEKDNHKTIFSEQIKPNSLITKRIDNIKILDPACGSGRFIFSLAEYLFNFHKLIDPLYDNYELKKKIIENNIYGIDSDEEACLISKLRLYMWLISEIKVEDIDSINIIKIHEKTEIGKLKTLFKSVNVQFNIENLEFLLKYQSDEKFDIVIGNPPYIENKKIKNINYKRDLYKNFKSAYKLFDLSILFIEKSLRILRKNSGYISFVITNKFLSSDYGIKIRDILIKNSEIEKIINISSLQIFTKKSTYPIIIFIRNKIPKDDHKILLSNIQNSKKLRTQNEIKEIIQKRLYYLPGKVIPLKGNIDLIYKLYSNYKTMEEKFEDLKIIYRPYGFIDYVKYYQEITKNKESNKDLVLIGTGNVGKYFIKFNKEIRIAKKRYNVSYINPQNKNQSLWKDISKNKLIFREIAKELTCVFDPGVFTNITGLYFILIPSQKDDFLFGILSILNSKFIDIIFKTLFGTLHMSGGYLRFNGSFIKKLPMPNHIPLSLIRLGKIMQFLCQLYYDQSHNETYYKSIDLIKLNDYSKFFNSLSESLIKLLYLSGFNEKLNMTYQELNQLLFQENLLPDIESKFTYPYFNLSMYKIASKEEQFTVLSKINIYFEKFKINKELIKEIKKLASY